MDTTFIFIFFRILLILHLTMSSPGKGTNEGHHMETDGATTGHLPFTTALNELDPNVQAQLFDRISQEIRDQVRVTLAAIPAVNLQAGGTNPNALPAAGHAAGSRTDSCVDGRRPIGDMNVNFNWGSSLTTSTDDQDVSTPTLTQSHLSINHISPLHSKKASRLCKLKRPRSPSPNREVVDLTSPGHSVTKRRKLTANISTDRKYKQTCLTSFFKNETENTKLDDGDLVNVSHLVALVSDPIHLEYDDQTPVTSSNEAQDSLPNSDRVRRAKQREPLIFSEPNPTETVCVLNEENQVDEGKVDLLRKEISEHNLRLFERSLRRAKQHFQKIEVNDSQDRLKIFKNITVQENSGMSEKIPRSIFTNVSPSFSPSSYPTQDGSDLMTDGARSTWNRSRTVSVDAIKARTRAAFYREAPGQNLMEYWVYGLERTPGFLMKLPNFRSALQAMRMKHAKEIMLLAADHLDKEVKRNSDQAAVMKSGAIKLINENNPPDVAAKIIAEASASYDITISNMASNEYKEFERRRQTLERSPPTPGDIQDPAANVAKNSTRIAPPTSTNTQSTNRGGQRGRGNRGFHQRGRGGRGSSRPGKQRGGRKPYSRPDN